MLPELRRHAIFLATFAMGMAVGLACYGLAPIDRALMRSLPWICG
ncbi:hypothetical protein PE067_08670 [Paracoccus sp. DMF-8]|nr:hypothetical protein [Paracoccus sp. DMF-8]MDF3606197.1 hypothetical protein [Paracoccus sp. DMF-8]